MSTKVVVDSDARNIIIQSVSISLKMSYRMFGHLVIPASICSFSYSLYLEKLVFLSRSFLGSWSCIAAASSAVLCALERKNAVMDR